MPCGSEFWELWTQSPWHFQHQFLIYLPDGFHVEEFYCLSPPLDSVTNANFSIILRTLPDILIILEEQEKENKCKEVAEAKECSKFWKELNLRSAFFWLAVKDSCVPDQNVGTIPCSGSDSSFQPVLTLGSRSDSSNNRAVATKVDDLAPIQASSYLQRLLGSDSMHAGTLTLTFSLSFYFSIFFDFSNILFSF